MYTGELLYVESEHDVDEIVILVKSGVLCYVGTTCSVPGVFSVLRSVSDVYVLLST